MHTINSRFAVSEQPGPTIESRISAIQKLALDLYVTQKFWCSEAVLVALNRCLNGGLSDAQALAIGAPFSKAMGNSGCMCGAVSGAVMAVGLILGQSHPYRHRRNLRHSARRLHDQFISRYGSTCCRVLTRHVSQDKKALVAQCADHVAHAARMAAQLILERQPDRAAMVRPKPSVWPGVKVMGMLRRARYFFTC